MDKSALQVCAACGKEAPSLKVCGGCRGPKYCSQACQKEDWKSHKKECHKATGAQSSASKEDRTEEYPRESFKRGQSALLNCEEFGGLKGRVVLSPDDGDDTPNGCVLIAFDLPNDTSNVVSVSPHEIVRPCYVDSCTKPGRVVCGRCKKRIYCGSDCSTADWIDHKAYCEPPMERPPPTRAQLHAWYISKGKFANRDGSESCLDQVELPTFDTIWRRFEKSHHLGSPDMFQEYVIDYVLQAIGSPVKMHQKSIREFGAIRLSDPSARAEMMALPLHGPYDGRTAGAAVTVSFSCFGLDHESGQLSFRVVCVDLATGHLRYTNNLCGRPTKYDFELAFYLGCTRPMPSGSDIAVLPCRPSELLVAHRWGVDIFNYIKARCDALEICADFESYAAAAKSAAKHGNDPMGLNYLLERDKDYSLNGTLGPKKYQPPAIRNAKTAKRP